MPRGTKDTYTEKVDNKEKDRYTLDVRNNMSKTIDQIVVTGNLDELTQEQRTIHYMNVCEAMGIDHRTHPLEYLHVDDPNGGRRVILYSLKKCTDQLGVVRKIKITRLTREITEDMVTFTAEAMDKDGQADISTGSVTTKGKKGAELANASMAAETKAKRRVTLSISGSGLLDETEIADIEAPTSLPPGIGVTAMVPKLGTPAVNQSAGKEVKTEHVSVVIPFEAQAVLSDPKATSEQIKAAHATEILAPDPAHAPKAGEPAVDMKKHIESVFSKGAEDPKTRKIAQTVVPTPDPAQTASNQGTISETKPLVSEPDSKPTPSSKGFLLEVEPIKSSTAEAAVNQVVETKDSLKIGRASCRERV